MRSPACALALAVSLAATLAAVTPSPAFFHITTTACDTVSTAPLQVRTSFDIDLVGPGGYCWFEVFPRPVGPGPNDATVFYSASAPAGWFVGPDALGSGDKGFLVSRFPDCFRSGDHLSGFQIVANRPGPCALFIFDNPVMEGDSGEGCLVLDGPVPARPASWGEVKAIYRE